ncbi:hypothetical protein AYO21_07253 [Fonsecaea monophora]|uniref:ATP-dependent DNA helicase n=1 Tax=Fonsecaea monophora TaxID=254056 RepID=A0A177F2S9_9EURO|nr:hypothetical protein AYO21_07253 [Fonsecaea monophora]KAH0826840.1 ATP-dependent DNA helicase PIF1 [Fonsecaea pedrosoi]OAG38593.1 hypothetical protein AYO21_07253 [Fonsecaea monophora]
MDPGPGHPSLPELTQIEEMLIARVHVTIEVRQVRGAQYRYKGHICNFLRDTGLIYSKLPLLPRDLELVLLRPPNADANPLLNRQFRRDFRVRQRAIREWLQFLRLNHPGYSNIEIDEAALQQLPIDDSIADQLITEEVPDSVETVGSDEQDVADEDEGAQTSVIPDLLAREEEIEGLRRQVVQRRHLTLPPMRATPLSEFNTTQPMLSWAFPTLFPYGIAEFVTPRLRSITYTDYVKHLLKYQDGRFAKHPRFRYVVFNTIMRKQVNTRSSFFVKKTDREEMTIDDLRAAFDDNTAEAQALLNSITRHADSLRGTRPFWAGRRRQLEAFVKNLGSPHLFVTLSAADYHWHDLMKHLPEFDRWEIATPDERIRIARRNIRDNPLIVAYYFHARLEAFKQTVLIPKFNIKDQWSRYEWQSRGSTHTHGCYWSDGTPDPDVDQLDPELMDYFARFWGIHISAINPQKDRQQLASETPLSLAHEDQQNELEHLSAVVNRVQRHQCSEAYCLRKEKATGTIKCRFNYPQPERETPGLEIPVGSTFYRFQPARNDGRLNNYNRLVSLAWLANTDIAPCTGAVAVLNYIAKYTTKAERQSESYQQIATRLLPHLNTTRPLTSFVSKTMNRLLGERDWSAQEVCHLLLDLPLSIGSRPVQLVDCRPEAQQATNYRLEDEGDTLRRGQSPLQKYKLRPERLEGISFLQMLRLYNFRRSDQMQLRPRAPPQILNYYPRYKPSDVENYARIKLTLHVPFREIDDLLRLDDERFETFPEAFDYWQQVYGPTAEPDFLEELPPEPEEQDEFEDLPDDDEDIQQSWEVLARQLPNRDDNIRIEDPDQLGDRDLDREYDWTPHVGRFTFPDDYWKELKQAEPASLHAESTTIDPDQLERQQRRLYDFVVADYAGELAGLPPPQFLLNLDGKAGTGKSFVIMLISATLQQMATNAGRQFPILRAAPTGVAAHGISGRTLHALLRLPIKFPKSYEKLSQQNLQAAQSTMREIRYLIIDEKSMIGLKMMSWMDQRLREIYPTRDLPFGGINIIIAGDFCQLPPVAMKPLFFQGQLVDPTEVAGRTLYNLFDKTIELNVIKRQDGQTTEAIAFREALNALREDRVTVDDWGLLTTRVAGIIPHEIPTFDDAIHIYGKKQQVNEVNHARMRDLQQPVLKIMATHEGLKANEASSDAAGNLHAELPLALGTRIMLTENIWVERGLVNGALGTVRDIVWKADVDWRQEPPLALIVQFDRYEGPSLQNEGTVPIFRSRREFYRGAVNCSRKQFPVTVAYAITVHKAQGMTVERAVLDLTERDFAAGLSYVAVSRVKTLSGILFKESFDYERFQVRPSETVKARNADRQRRSTQHLGTQTTQELVIRSSSPVMPE